MAENTPSSSAPRSAGPVVLKKYGNRRIYDTSLSRYITLHEVEEMVQKGVELQVFDAKTGDDLTKEILVQIILDKEGAREMLPTSFLRQVVKLSASPLKEAFSRTVQDSLDSFLSGQRAVLEAQRAMLNQVAQMPVPMPWNPFAPFAGPPPSSMSSSGMMSSMPSSVSQSQHGGAQSQHSASHSQQNGGNGNGNGGNVAASEVDRLRAEVTETQALLRQLIQQQQPVAPVSTRASAKRRRAAR